MSDYSNNVSSSTNYPERIVSLSPSNTEILFAIGEGDKVVGVTDYCNYPSQLKMKIKKNEVVRVGGYWNPSIETIMDLKPDLVLISTAKCTDKANDCKTDCSRRCELTTNVANKLKNIGFNVLILAPHSISDVLDNILIVGNATGNDFQALELVGNLKKRIDALVFQANKMPEKPRVYFEVWNNPYISVNSKTWIGNLINLAGGINIFGDTIPEWPIISSEDVIQKDPDIMVFPYVPDVPRFWGGFDTVNRRQGWGKISAIRTGRLYEVLRDCISRPGPRLVQTLELLVKLFHTSN